MRAKEFLREFAPEGYEQYTLYVGGPKRHKIGTFSSIDDAVEEAHFLWNVDPSAGTDYWTITDLNDTVVWSHDPGEVHDQMRGGSKIQFRKPGDLTETDDQDLTDLKAACENWMEMYFDANDIKTILTHPYSQQFKKPPADINKLYRGLVVKGGKIKSVPGKSNRKFVAYATHEYGAEAFLASLDVGGRKVIVEKQFNPADFVLDFTGLYESLFPEHVTAFNRYETEYEVWMRATPYYTSVDEKEIVSDTAWGQTGGEPRRGLLELAPDDSYSGDDGDNIIPWEQARAAIAQFAEDSNALDFEVKDGGQTAVTTWGPELGYPYSAFVMFISPQGDGMMRGMLFGLYEDGEFDMRKNFVVPRSMNGVDHAARIYMDVRS